MARVVILGSSFGGLSAAYALRKRLGPQHDVVLVSNSSLFVFRPSLPWVIFGLRRPDQVTADFTRGLDRRGIDFLQATVTRIDPERRHVLTTKGDVEYDHLVIALGAHLDRDAIPGLDAHTDCVLWLDDALRLRDKLERFRGGTIAILDVQGSPLACPGYEVALGLATFLRRRGLRENTRIYFISHAPTPFAPAGPRASAAVARELARAGVHWIGNAGLRSAAPGGVTLADGRAIEADLFVTFPPYRGTDALLRTPELADRRGFVETDRSMESIRFPNVYAVGDAVSFSGPKSGRMAEVQAHVAAHNVACRINGSGPLKRYRSHLVCLMELGDGRGLFAYRREAPTHGPTTFAASVSGRLPHIAKALWEKYYLATRF